MGYASRSGRAITHPDSPRAFGVCDRCGIWFNLHRLTYQYEWQGVQLVNLRFRVCRQCLDKPQPQLKARLMPPDPVPVADPRVEQQRWPLTQQFVSTEPGQPVNPLTPLQRESGGGGLEIEP